MSSPHPMPVSTAIPTEIEHFNQLAHQWWDENGPFAILHQLNPIRIDYIRSQIFQHISRDILADMPLKGLSILDVGCGGGLISEPLTRLGAQVTGLDAAEENIHAAQAHAALMDLNIPYIHSTLEEHEGQYDVVLAIEVVEHVASIPAFLKAAQACLKPGGLLVVSTINRTLRSLILGKYIAEYVLNWVPRGTHNWQQFITPRRLGHLMTRQGFQILDLRGLGYDFMQKKWRLSSNRSINYFMTAQNKKF